MAFTSFDFLVFVLVTVVAYYIVPKKARWVVLLIASYAFYFISSASTFVFLLVTTVVTFFGGLYIGRVNDAEKAYLKEHGGELSREEKKARKAESKRQKRRMVALILIIDFGILAVLKYFRVYLEMLQIPGFSFDLGAVLIPLGISFYTFQSAAYIIDLYRSKIQADTNIAKFALFTSFFPQIVQGPIARHDQLAHQLYEGHDFKYENIAHGAQLMLWGFFKKLVIADRAALLVNQVYGNYGDYQGWVIALALLFYMIQLYGDFSGGIDIARGVARCMGIDMAHNFNQPYFAVSLSDFWRRWHISLSSWCRDYIFFPISLSKTFGKAGKSLRKVLGDRVGKLFPIIIAQLATFTTIGLWHGADFKYVAYGWYNAAVILSGLLLEPYLKRAAEALHINTAGSGWKAFSIFRTFIIVMIGRVFPRAESFPVAISMLGSMCAIDAGTTLQDFAFSFGMTGYDYLVLGIAVIIWIAISVIREHEQHKSQNGEKAGIVAGKETETTGQAETGAECRLLIDKLPLPARWAIYLAGFAAVLVFGVYGPGYDAAAFIYRAF